MTVIVEAKLQRMERDLYHARLRHTSKSPTLSRFEYDHGHLLVVDSTGKKDLLITSDGDHIRQCAARALQHCSPSVVGELIRGYRLAKDAGLLGAQTQ